MKTKLFLFFSLIILAISLSACTSADVASSWPSVTIDSERNTAYLAYNQYVYAVDLTTGIQKWKFPAKSSKGESFYSAPALTPDGQLIVGSYNHILYSINPDTGQANSWSFKAKHRIIGSPLVVDNVIYLPAADGKLYALDLTLKEIWNTPFSTKGANWARPATDGACQCIYIASMDHYLYAVNTKNGTVIWKKDLGGALVGTPTVGPDGKLYLGSFNSEMITIDDKTGNIIGQPFKTGGRVWAGPALSNGRLYFGDLQGNFYVLNTQDGSSTTTKVEGAIIGTPLVISDTVYVTTESGNLYVIDKDGKILKPAYNITKGKLQASPIQYKDMILLTPVGSDKYLIALDANENQVWVFPTPKAK
jgi:eukaryotic-like serine/threonine-protein kinase